MTDILTQLKYAEIISPKIMNLIKNKQNVSIIEFGTGSGYFTSLMANILF